MTTTFGRSVRRLEDEAILARGAVFVDDIDIPGCLHLIVIRSPFANTTVSIDTSAAGQAAGVVGVWAGDDLAHLSLPQVGVELEPRPVVARRRARHAGEPVAVIVAESRRDGLRAADLVDADFDPDPAAVTLEAARAPGAPRVDPALPDNVAYTVDVSDPDPDLLSAADVVVSLDLVNQRVAPGMLEGRAVAAIPEGNGLVVHASHQMPHKLSQWLARALGIPAAAVRVIVPDVGGGFGAKASVYPEDVLVAHLARELQRPVKFVEDRTENLTTTAHGRGQRAHVEIGATAEGRLVGLRAGIDVDFGAYVDNQRYSAALTAMMACGAYRMATEVEVRGILTHTPPMGAFRGAGRPEAAYMVERAVDTLARSLRIDPVEFRLANFIPPEAFPYDTGTGAVYDSGNYAAALTAAAERIDYAGWRRTQAERRAAGSTRLLGIGVASYVELSSSGKERATVTIGRDGSVVVATGTSPSGQGHRTTWAQLVADQLGLEPEDIEVVLADTGRVGSGGGTAGSRSAPLGGSAVALAAATVANDVRRLAATRLEAAADDIVLAGGRATVAGTNVGLSLGDVAAGAGGTIAIDEEFDAPNLNYPFGTHICVVEVDIETGEIEIVRYVSVDDCGAVINPMIVEGQFHGGTMQGVAQALYERIEFDASGGLVTANFMSYALPDILQAPDQEAYRTETPSPNNDLGLKGAGEAGATGSTPAVANAVMDALAPFGVTDTDLPMPYTPERVWRAIAAARAR